VQGQGPLSGLLLVLALSLDLKDATFAAGPGILRKTVLPDDHLHACRDIKHLYHYYLHGKEGRRPGHLKPSAAKDGILPEIIIQRLNNNRLAWRKSLIDVSDDMESKILEVHITQVLPSEHALCQHPFPG
jgi:hypothetical protein